MATLIAQDTLTTIAPALQFGASFSEAAIVCTTGTLTVFGAMKIVGLVSGGKDSCYNLLECVAAGHEIVALAHLISASKDEIDSYMYQTVGQTGMAHFAEAMGLPLYSRIISGSSLSIGRSYSPAEGDEVEDLFELLKIVKESCDVEGVSVGAVLSDYQRVRVESVCARLELTPLAYLWRRNQEEILHSMIDIGIRAIVIKVASIGLYPKKHLGKDLKEMKGDLEHLKHLYGSSVIGEGGEFESFTLDCPLFKKRIKIDDQEIVNHTTDDISPVGYMRFKKLSLEEKEAPCHDWKQCVPTPLHFVKEILGSRVDLGISTGLSPELDLPPCRVNAKMETAYVSGGFFKIFASVLDGKIGRVLHMASEHLRKEGLSFQNVTQVVMFINRMKNYASMNAKYSSYFEIDPPTRACVEVPMPENVDAFVEMTVARDVPDSLLVRSVSHWAPAVIGPYSQASVVGSVVFVAGQIGLVPGSMTMIPGGAREQSMLALRHVARILNVVTKSEFDNRLPQVFDGVCFLSKSADRHVVDETWQEGGRCETMGALELLDTVIVSALPRNALVEWHVNGRWCDLESVSHVVESTVISGAHVTRRRLSDKGNTFRYESVLLEDKIVSNGASGEGSSKSSVNVTEALREVVVKFYGSSEVDGFTVYFVHDKMIYDEVVAIMGDVGKKGIVVPVLGLATDAGFALVRVAKH